MASFTPNALLFATYLTLFSITSYGISDGTLRKICGQTEYHTECEKIFKSDPRVKSATLPQLSLMFIELASTKAVKDSKFFAEYKTDDPMLKTGLVKCVEMYNGAIRTNLTQAHKLSEVGDYVNSSESVDLAMEGADLCESFYIPKEFRSVAHPTPGFGISCGISIAVNKYIVAFGPGSKL